MLCTFISSTQIIASYPLTVLFVICSSSGHSKEQYRRLAVYEVRLLEHGIIFSNALIAIFYCLYLCLPFVSADLLSMITCCLGSNHYEPTYYPRICTIGWGEVTSTQPQHTENIDVRSCVITIVIFRSKLILIHIHLTSPFFSTPQDPPLLLPSLVTP